MTTSPSRASRRHIAIVAGSLLLASTGCQRQEPATGTASDAAPATAPTAPVTTPAAPVITTTTAIDELPTGVLRAYVWQCEDGQKLVMRNLVREKAIAIDFHDGTRRLDHALSASGARYADSVVTFWSKGSAATLERKGAPAVKCVERRAESLREDARARGVAYRALGNEPGWVLEIGPDDRLRWTTNYGEQQYDFERAQHSATAGAAADSGVSYTAQQGTNSVKATMTKERCVDDGEVEFPLTATVEFEGQIYRGCGDRLQPR